jgi:transcriptional regulator with XRE-family HTH domain
MCIISSVEIGGLIRGARQDAGLTQCELADRAHTAQPAVATYESGARTPNIATLERLLRACDHDVEVLARPRVRRGAASLAELAPTIADDLGAGRERDAVRLLFGFADDFRGSSRPGRISLIREEPPSTGDARFDAALAGVAELFAADGALPAPTWVNGPSRFVEPWWFHASKPAFHAYTLAHTPALLARHGVFIAREVFDRA